LFSGTLGSPKQIPVIGVTHEFGAELLSIQPPGATFQIVVNTQLNIYTTSNVIADTNFPNEDLQSIIVIGSHLDSVPAGAGINDNGSGSSTLLQIALELMSTKNEVNNHIRFCWWGAEELGLLGSTYYVNQLVLNGGIDDIVLNLNYDMIASPNFFRGVYNGYEAPSDILQASITIAELHISYYSFNHLAWNFTAFTGRSDYGPFIENNVPAGGLFTGAEETKIPEWREYYGGIALAAFDTCYHLDCDNLLNINFAALEENSNCAFYVLLELVKQTDLISFLNTPSPKSHHNYGSLPFKSSSYTIKN